MPTNGLKGKTSKPRPARAARGKPARIAAIVQQAQPKLRPQLSALANPLTYQDEAELAYLTTLSDPFIENPAGVPLILGSGGVRTIKVSIPRTFTVTCNSSGFGFLTMNADAWIGGSGDDYFAQSPYRYAAYVGQTSGQNVWYSNSNYVGTALPASADTTTRTGLLGATMPTIDSSLLEKAEYRMVAMGLRCYPNDAALTTKGTIYVISTTEPYADASSDGLPLATEANFTSANPEVVSVQDAPLANWRSGHIMSTCAVPTTAQAFVFNSAVQTADAGVEFGHPQIGVCIYGAASGQTIKVKTVFVYEIEKQQDFRRGDMAEPVAYVEGSRLQAGFSKMIPSVSSGPSPVHSSGLHNGAGPLAFVHGLAQNRPAQIPALNAQLSKPSSNWASAAAAGLNFLADKAISFLPKKIANFASFAKDLFTKD